MKLNAFCILASLAVLLQPVSGFSISVHKDITEEALETRVVVVDGMNLKFTPAAIDDIEGDNADVDYLGFAFDYFHFDNEQFARASERLIEKVERTVLSSQSFCRRCFSGIVPSHPSSQ